MIKCPNCGRENADNFNFCLDCGYDLKAYREAFTNASIPAASVPPAAPQPPPAAARPAPAPAAPAAAPPPAPAAPAPPSAAAPVSMGSAAAPGPAPAAAGSTVCPSCSHQNAPGVRFCGACGKRVDGEPSETAGHARTMFMHAAAEPVAREKACKLITIDQSGREGMTFTLRAGETVCGRVNGIVLFEDPFVSPTHCKFIFQAGQLKVLDQGSLNGIYLRVLTTRTLVEGDFVRAGRQLFRFETLKQAAIQIRPIADDDSQIWGSPHPGAFGRIIQILDDGRTGEIRLLFGERCQLGREVGDIVIPSDGFISGRHCVFLRQGEDVAVQDLGSSNGTYVRVSGEADLVHGDFLLVGNQMLRVEIS